MSTSWDAQRYQDQHSFVWRFGSSLLGLLDPHIGEQILDVGCGTGQLTAEITQAGARVVGLDHSADMLRQARLNFPRLAFVQANASEFAFRTQFDAVFSNAALHWVKHANAAVACIGNALRPDGRFVAEFGGQGNIASIQQALRTVFGSRADHLSPWYFPSATEYTSLLLQHGIEVRQAELFDRPTSLEGLHAIEDWLRMFCPVYFTGLSHNETADKIRELADVLRPTQFRDGIWTLDYRRLRVVAVKTGCQPQLGFVQA